jgi:hypothetical protein
LVAIGAAIAAYTIQTFAALKPTGLLGLVVFLATLAVSLGLMLLVRARGEAVPATESRVAEGPVRVMR